jgi:hypothetical protein
MYNVLVGLGHNTCGCSEISPLFAAPIRDVYDDIDNKTTSSGKIFNGRVKIIPLCCRGQP